MFADEAEIEARWQELPKPFGGRVDLLVVRPRGGVHETPTEVVLDVERGAIGDRWELAPRRELDCQLTLMMTQVAKLLCRGELPLHLPGDNLLVDIDLSEAAAPVGARFRVGEAEVEITPEPHTGCAKFSTRFGQPALRWVNADGARRLRGVNARVLRGGVVKLGDAISRI